MTSLIQAICTLCIFGIYYYVVFKVVTDIESINEFAPHDTRYEEEDK